MIVCQNEQEGSYTIENMVKIKNIDYDAYDMCPIDLDNLQESKI